MPAHVMAIVSKAVFEKDMPDAEVGDFYETSLYRSRHAALEGLAGGGTLWLVTIRPGEQLWVVAVLRDPDRTDDGWEALNCEAITDITSLRGALRFSTGQGLTQEPGKHAMSMQTPRLLTRDDHALLEQAIGSAFTPDDDEDHDEDERAEDDELEVGDDDVAEDTGEARALHAAWSRQWALDRTVYAMSVANLGDRAAARGLTYGPRSREAELRAFEQRARIMLPPDYREFLLQVGNDGPGPHGDLVELGQSFAMSGGDPGEMTDEEIAALSRRFVGDQGPEDEDEDDADWNDHLFDGALPLSDAGCAEYAYLVLTGEHRGEVWELQQGRWSPIATPLVRRVTFREWLAAWLLHDDAD